MPNLTSSVMFAVDFLHACGARARHAAGAAAPRAHDRARPRRDARGVRAHDPARRRSAERGGRRRSSRPAARAAGSSCSTASRRTSPGSPPMRRSACSSSASRRSRTGSGSARPLAPRGTSSSTRSRPTLAGEADDLSTWFLHDPDPWTGNRIPHGELRRARAVHPSAPQGRAHARERADGHRPPARSRAEGRLVVS